MDTVIVIGNIVFAACIIMVGISIYISYKVRSDLKKKSIPVKVENNPKESSIASLGFSPISNNLNSFLNDVYSLKDVDPRATSVSEIIKDFSVKTTTVKTTITKPNLSHLIVNN